MESPGSWARILRECEFCLRQTKAMTSEKFPETAWYLDLLNFLCHCCTSDKGREHKLPWYPPPEPMARESHQS